MLLLFRELLDKSVAFWKSPSSKIFSHKKAGVSGGIFNTKEPVTLKILSKHPLPFQGEN